MTEIFPSFKVKLGEKIKKKMDYFSQNYPQEIGGFIIGELKKDEVYAEDLIFPTQRVNKTLVEINAKDQVLMRKEYGDVCKKIIGAWHSHNSMGSHWSATDEDEFIKPYMKNKDVGLFIVSSKGDHLIRLNLNKPFKMYFDKLDYEVEIKEESPFIKEMKEIINSKVTEKEVTFESYDFSNERTNYFDVVKSDEVRIDDYVSKRVNELFSQNKKERTFELSNINLSWLEEIISVLGNDFTYRKDLVNEDYVLNFKFDNKKEFKNKKREIKDILKSLIYDELNIDEDKNEI